MASDKRVVINETVESVLTGKPPHKTITSCYTLEEYNEMHVFLPVDVIEDVVKSIAQKCLGSLGHGGTESEALQGWPSKFRKDIKILCTRVKILLAGCPIRARPWHPTVNLCLSA